MKLFCFYFQHYSVTYCKCWTDDYTYDFICHCIRTPRSPLSTNTLRVFSMLSLIYERQRIHSFSLFFLFPSEDPFLLKLLREVAQCLKARVTVSLRALNLVYTIQGRSAAIYKTSNKFIKWIHLTAFPNFYNWIVLDCSPQFWLETYNINIQ